MKLLLSDELFTLSASDDLDRLCILAFQFGHGLALQVGDHDVDVGEASQFSVWLTSRDHVTQARWHRLLGDSIDRMRRSRCVVRVTNVSASDWTAIPPVLSRVDAIKLAAKAAEVFVENHRNDGVFLKVFARRDQREAIESAIQDGHLAIT